MLNIFSNIGKLFGARNEDAHPSSNLGRGGYKKAGGYVYDEYMPELRGLQGRKKYREMADTDPIIGAMLYGISAIIRASTWRFEPAEADNAEAKKYAEWMDDVVFNMPGITWDQAIEDALSMLPYGFCMQEIVTMYREKDGTIGLQKLAPRSQETLLKWDTDKTGEIFGVWQSPPEGGFDIHLPINKLIHYKTCYARGNPEGRSMLRNSYQSYHISQSIIISEAIGVERDLAGLPVFRAPAKWLNETGNRAIAERIVRDIRLNDQSGLVLDSDTFEDKDGAASDVKKFDLELLSSGSSSKIDTDKMVKRHAANMARTLLADFIVIGTDGKGSYALSTDKSSLFIRAVEGICENIAQTIDRQLTPRLWAYNGFNPEMMPKLAVGGLSPTDIEKLGDYIAKLAGAGVFLNDEETENFLRAEGGLPPVPEERPDPIADPEEATDEEGDADPKNEKKPADDKKKKGAE